MSGAIKCVGLALLIARCRQHFSVDGGCAKGYLLRTKRRGYWLPPIAARHLVGFFLMLGLPWAIWACPTPWPAWQQFQLHHVTPEGRVIDHSDPRQITTSEGQSYALFFALVDNNPALFEQLLHWTEQNLAQGDLQRHLPAWLWGQQSEGAWGVLDDNPAADADLWIAYSLLEAGRLWQQRRYTVLGHALLRLISKQELVELPHWGWALLPAPHGFVDAQGWRLNPSYLPPQLGHRLAQAVDTPAWKGLQAQIGPWLKATAPLGIAPDWVVWDGKSWGYPTPDEQWASYNAIRVYLWVGMMPDEMPQATALKQHFRRAASYFDHPAGLAEHLQVESGQAAGAAPAGFAAALMPLFADQPLEVLLKQQLDNISISAVSGKKVPKGYYNQVLTLFAEGWLEGRYAFGTQGDLLPQWEGC